MERALLWLSCPQGPTLASVEPARSLHKRRRAVAGGEGLGIRLERAVGSTGAAVLEWVGWGRGAQLAPYPWMPPCLPAALLLSNFSSEKRLTPPVPGVTHRLQPKIRRVWSLLGRGGAGEAPIQPTRANHASPHNV